eukprot:Skav221348  [mRNA]  locus=scaffold1845:143227:156381:- [translate_table: standard]
MEVLEEDPDMEPLDAHAPGRALSRRRPSSMFKEAILDGTSVELMQELDLSGAEVQSTAFAFKTAGSMVAVAATDLILAAFSNHYIALRVCAIALDQILHSLALWAKPDVESSTLPSAMVDLDWLRVTAAYSCTAQQRVHWFDGMFLASFLVSSGQLIDPVNRRSLSRGECKSLDEYIFAHGFPSVHVTDAFDLAKAVKSTSSGPAASRMAALEREAASMLRSLFDFRSVGSGGSSGSGDQHVQPEPVPPAPMEAVPEGSEANEAASSVHWPALGETPEVSRLAPEPAPEGERRIRVCTQRTVHNDGGLQVVDDTEFDVEYEEEEMTEEPTLAESAASAPRRSRLARLPRSRGDGAQITFSVTGRRTDLPEGRRGGPGTRKGTTVERISERVERSESESSEESQEGALEVETWIPDWATPDLHERLLSELEVIEAMFPEEIQMLTPEVKSHLEGCLLRGVVSRAADPLRFQVSQHVDGPRGGCTVQVEFSMPPFYPLHDANVLLRGADDAPGWIRDGLLNLQATLRTEFLPSLEGSEVIQKVIDWLQMHGPAVLSSAERDAADPKRRAKQAEPEAEPAASKAERIEQARKERLSAKFTEKWDLCYAFVKHGSCKDKNCQWRHELPKKEEKEEKPPKEETKDQTKPAKASGSGKSTAKAGGKKKR